MSQVNIFMLADDVKEFAKFACEDCGMIMLQGSRFETDKPEPVVDFDTLNGFQEMTLIDATLFEKYHLRKMDSGIWMYDMFKAPSIEFSVPHFLDNGRLLSGRIYAKIGWLDSNEDNRLYKSGYGKLERRIKRDYHKIEGSWWVSSRVKTWSLDGGVLAFGSELAMSKSLTPENFRA